MKMLILNCFAMIVIDTAFPEFLDAGTSCSPPELEQIATIDEPGVGLVKPGTRARALSHVPQNHRAPALLSRPERKKWQIPGISSAPAKG